MPTQRQVLENDPVEIVSELNLVAGERYTLQVSYDGSLEYSESADAATEMPTPRHVLASGHFYTLTVPDPGKIWVRAVDGNGEFVITEAA